jgi:hypothetical protein
MVKRQYDGTNFLVFESLRFCSLLITFINIAYVTFTFVD